MRIHGKLLGIALGTGVLFAGAAYAGTPEPVNSQVEHQERIARDEIRRGQVMEQEGHRLEQQGKFRRGQALERRGENLERHGQQLLNAAERREHYHR